MNDEKRLTQTDVAAAAGVERTTVSLALRNHPSIPKTTRDRIKAIAKRMGYVPDPMLSALISYRNKQRRKSYQGTIAWLVNNQPGFDWAKISHFTDYYQGACEQAKTYGYNVEIFNLLEKGMTPAKWARIFRSRNINGILLCPQPQPNTRIDFPWDHFSVITFGYSLVWPRFHTAAPTQFRSMVEVMRQLHKLGYRRIGFACSLNTDSRVDHNYLAGYFVEKYLAEGEISIPPFDEETATPANFRAWHSRYKPDALVTNNPRLLTVIRKAGIRVPEDLGVACPSLPDSTSDMSGIYENSPDVGKAAIDFLVGKLHQDERGIPKQPHYVHVPGIWFRGNTVKDLRKATAKVKA